ncbi:hypothetical protein BCO26_0285 [Heyndrickxia coagulans 2-6]|nr:hypothetical protein BCO26_0285 [Heyndrickxia coagulans 2-6]
MLRDEEKRKRKPIPEKNLMPKLAAGPKKSGKLGVLFVFFH